MKRLFVTGTDTGVGKTFVSCAMAREARSRGERVFAFKPVETGCPVGTLGEDQTKLVEAAGGWQTGELAGLYQFADPVAPSVAAAREGRSIDLDHIAKVLGQGSQEADLVLVEGAGGWRVPISETLGMRDLAKLVDRVVVVARAGLGTINHSLLTLEAVERDGLWIEALIVSIHPSDDLVFARSNIDEIKKRWSGRVLDTGTFSGT